MRTEHRAIIAVAVSAAFFFFWYTYMSPPKQAEQPAETPAAAESAKAPAPAPSDHGPLGRTELQPTGSGDPQAGLPITTARLKNNLVEMEITNDGGALLSWKALDYRQTTAADSPLIDLASAGVGFERPLALKIQETGFSIPDRPRYEIKKVSDSEISLSWRRPGEISIVKKIRLEPDRYVADVTAEITNEASHPVNARASLAWSAVNAPQEKGGFFSFLKRGQADASQPVFYIDGGVRREKEPKESATAPGAVYWSGIESRYFISAIVPRIQGEGLAAFYGGEAIEGAEQGTRGVLAGVSLPTAPLAPRSATSAAFTVYAGPKDINRLKAMDVRLEKAIDYGWFTFIAVPILYMLKFFHSLIQNYGIAIILLTIVVKLALHPINVKSLKSMKAMQQLQPRLKEMQAKYKGDKQRINQETMQLFRSHKVNPMGGCLPMVLQLPIYIALYRVLWGSIELYHAPFFWFYRDLSAPDPYMITPILLGVFMIAQQMVMPSASADPAQKKMMMLMPIMFTGFMLFLPVGLVVYILVNTAMSVTQQWMYNNGIGFADLIRGRANLRAVIKGVKS